MHKLALTVAAGLLAGAASAQDFDLPKQLSWTAYDTGSSGYNQAVAIGAALQQAAGINLRVLPGKNDLSRLEPVRQGRVPFAANGIGTYLAQEGVTSFADKAWGPQKLRVVLNNIGSGSGAGLGVTRAACERVGKPDCEGFTDADMKGLRVAYVKGAPGLNVNAEAMLASGGLTWDDVEIVEFGGNAESWKAMVDGSVDAAYTTTTSGNAYEVDSSPNGLFFPSVDPEDKQAWEMMHAVAPHFVPVKSTLGATLDGTEGKITPNYPYPILVTYDTTDADLAYNMAKAMVATFDAYKDGAPGTSGWALENQVFNWVVPFHEGAVRYFEEAGVWSEEAQAHQDMLVKRQDVLVAAWEELVAEDPENWEEAWAEKRRTALEAEGMPAPF